MQPLGKLGKDELLDALSHYYDRCREIADGTGSEKEYLSCRLKIDSILRELNNLSRNVLGSPKEGVVQTALEKVH